MSETSNIAWTDCTYNPWIGCRAVSPGCQNCYARTLVNGRMAGDFSKRRRTAPATFNAPLKWNKKPWICDSCGQPYEECLLCSCEDITDLHRRRVFLGSLMDWLDPEVPIEWLADALDIVRRCPDLIFQCVTKRPELFYPRLEAVAERFGEARTNFECWVMGWYNGNAPSNVWVITSIEDQKRADERIPKLLKVPASVHGLSVEPLLERICLNGVEVDWVIVGAESGPHRRDCGVDAIVSVAEQCKAAGVPCYIKQGCAFKPGQQVGIPDSVWSLKQFPISTNQA